MEELGEFNLVVWGEFDGLADGVNEPAKDDLAGAPTAVSLEEFLQGHGFVTLFRRYVGRANILSMA